MNEKVELLLMSYVDGDLDSKEVAEAEDIIKNNKEALEFVNKIKEANLQLKAYYKEATNDDVIKRLQGFIQSDILHKKTSKSKTLQKIFTLNPFFNYAFTALLFLSIGLFYEDSFKETTANEDDSMPMETNVYQSLDSFDIFENNFDKISNKIINKTKSLSNDDVDFSDFNGNLNTREIIEDAINEMVNNLNGEMVLSYGNESLNINILYQFNHSKELSCYLGTISHMQISLTSKFNFCKSIDDSSMLLYELIRE